MLNVHIDIESSAKTTKHHLCFLLWQSRALSEGQVVGRVLLGAEAAGAGRAHWTDMVSLQGQARWHIVQPETCHLVGAATMEPIIVEHSEANVVK